MVRPLEQRRVLSVSPAVAMALSATPAETDVAQGVAANPDPATPLGTDGAHEIPLYPGNSSAQVDQANGAAQQDETSGPAAESHAESDNASAAATAGVETEVEPNVESAVDDQQVGLVLDVPNEGPPPVVSEGSELVIEDIGVFTDTTITLDPEYEFTINWGDGKTSEGIATIDFPGAQEEPLAGSFDGAHIYADNGVYTVTVTLASPNGETTSDTLTVIVNNVDPMLNVESELFVVDEGALFSETFGFGDPGFDNPGNPEGELTEEFTFAIDWGDGSELDSGQATVDVPGAEGVMTEGSFVGSHIYADNGVYTLTVFVSDDDGGMDSQTFTVIVNNVAPTLELGEIDPLEVDEGQTFTITGETFQFRDPGFDNPENPEGELTEEFTFAIDWGDGSQLENGQATIDVAGGEGVFTRGSFSGTHTYADNGEYTVTVFISDDDGGMDIESFRVIVNNVVPVLGELEDRTVDEGALLSIVDMFQFTDPGFNNMNNPEGPTEESFTYTIDWGDDTEFVPQQQPVTNSTTGSPGVNSSGSFGGSHIYADNGEYTVTVTVFDDDGGMNSQTFIVTVNNVAPQVAPIENLSVDEGDPFSIADVGRFTDPGFDNENNVGGPTRETFVYAIDWGDDTTFVADPQAVTEVTSGSPGVKTAGSFDGSHLYADNGQYTVTVTVVDDDGGVGTMTFTVTVNNVAPTLMVVGDQTASLAEGFSIEDLGVFTDPGFDNPNNVGGATRETFVAMIDWGDGTPLDIAPAAVDALGGPGALTGGSFDGLHFFPTAGEFTVTVTVFDDDGGFDTGQFTVVAFVIKGNPPSIFVPGGAGGGGPPAPAAPPAAPADPVSGPQTTRFELRRPGSAAVAGAEPQLVLRVVSEPGSERLPDDVLDNLKKLFKRLPDGHYQIYRIEADGTERLVVDVIVREGRNIDVADDPDFSGDVSPPAPQESAPVDPAESPAGGNEVRSEETPDDARHEEPGEGQAELSTAAIAAGGYVAYAAPVTRRRLGRPKRQSPKLGKARRLVRRLRCSEC